MTKENTLRHQSSGNALDQKVGWHLKKIRRSQKKSISDIAFATQSDISTIIGIENGSIRAGENMLVLLAIALDVPVGLFFEEEQNFALEPTTNLAKTDYLLSPSNIATMKNHIENLVKLNIEDRAYIVHITNLLAANKAMLNHDA